MNSNSPPTEAILAAARDAVEKSSDELGAYGQYMSVVLQSATDSISAATAVFAAYAAPRHSLLDLEWRKKKAASILRSGAVESQIKDDSQLRSPAQYLEPPYSADDAPRVVQCQDMVNMFAKIAKATALKVPAA